MARPSDVSPHDLNAERSVLGGILIDNSRLEIADSIVTPESFFRPQHRYIFKAMLSLATLGAAIDPVTLKSQLSAAELTEIGPAYIEQLIDGVPHSSNVEHYARIVAEKSYRRSLIHFGTEFVRAARDGDQRVEKLLMSARECLASLESGSSEPAGRTVQLTPASAITVRPVRWLWENLLALGTLALLAGREGIGKSILVYTIAALLTRGRLPGAFQGTPRAVIVAATEDSWEHTIVPRLMAADADLALVFRADVVTPEGGDTAVSLPKDLIAFGQSIVNVNAALVVFDPILSRLDTKLDTHKDAEVRLALEPLVSLAGETDAVFLGLIHVNKSASSDALNTLMGSRAFAAVARAVLFVMADPDDEGVRLLGQAKNNLGPTDQPTRAFRIASHKVAETEQGPVWTGRLEWAGESTKSIRDVLQAATEAAGDRTATSEAADWLHDYLTSQDGTADSATIKAEGKKADHSSDALKRARKQLGITCSSEGFPRRTFWSLPQSGHQSEQPWREHPTAPTALTARTGDFTNPPTTLTASQSVQSAQSVRSGSVSSDVRPLRPVIPFDPDPTGRGDEAA